MIRSLFILSCVIAAGVGCSRSTPTPDAAVLPAPPPSGTKTEFVEYVRWAKFKPGTTMVKRTITEEKGNPSKTIETTTSKLLELTADHAVVETHLTGTRFDGVKMDTLPVTQKITRYFYLQDNAKVDKADKAKSETVTVAGKSYQASVVSGKDRNEAGEVTSTVWSSEEVPGGLLKSETLIQATGKLMTIELIELKPAE